MKKYPIQITENRKVKRITVWQSVADFLDAFNVERGLIYTIKLLFTRPGRLIRFYLEEGRYRVVNAFRLLIITTAVSLLLLNYSNSFEALYEVQGSSDAEAQKVSDLLGKIFRDWYNLIIWLSIPFYALFSFLLFRKYEKLNYAEHVVTQSFYISISNIIIICLFPLSFLIKTEIFFLISLCVGTFYYGFIFYTMYQARGFWFFMRIVFSFFLGNISYALAFAGIIIPIVDNLTK
ncbi:MAG: DUF3667 domain-containing protein [Bacteroidota bacterium]